MENLTLNFSLFYQVVVKGNIFRSQYDAVCLLLCGKLRKDFDENDAYIDDSTVSNFANGKKSVRGYLQKKHIEFDDEELLRRIHALQFQSEGNAAKVAQYVFSKILKQDSDDIIKLVDSSLCRTDPLRYLAQLYSYAIFDKNRIPITSDMHTDIEVLKRSVPKELESPKDKNLDIQKPRQRSDSLSQDTSKAISDDDPTVANHLNEDDLSPQDALCNYLAPLLKRIKSISHDVIIDDHGNGDKLEEELNFLKTYALKEAADCSPSLDDEIRRFFDSLPLGVHVKLVTVPGESESVLDELQKIPISNDERIPFYIVSHNKLLPYQIVLKIKAIISSKKNTGFDTPKYGLRTVDALPKNVCVVHLFSVIHR